VASSTGGSMNWHSRQIIGLHPHGFGRPSDFSDDHRRVSTGKCATYGANLFQTDFDPPVTLAESRPRSAVRNRAHLRDPNAQLTRTTPPGSDTTRAPNVALSWVITTSRRSSLNCAVKRLCPSASFTRMIRPGR
jgi:hypothetical protein